MTFFSTPRPADRGDNFLAGLAKLHWAFPGAFVFELGWDQVPEWFDRRRASGLFLFHRQFHVAWL